MVGKVTKIDEKARFRVDYVKMKIACRDISKIPKSAEGVLGLTLYDFGFERELYEEGNENILKSGIKVTEDQLSNKKPKGVGDQDISKLNKNTGHTIVSEAQHEKYVGKQVMVSAPPKLQYSSHTDSGPKLLKDAQKAYTVQKVIGMKTKFIFLRILRSQIQRATLLEKDLGS